MDQERWIMLDTDSLRPALLGCNTSGEAMKWFPWLSRKPRINKGPCVRVRAEGRRWEIESSETFVVHKSRPRAAADRVWIPDKFVLTRVWFLAFNFDHCADPESAKTKIRLCWNLRLHIFYITAKFRTHSCTNEEEESIGSTLQSKFRKQAIGSISRTNN